MEITAQSLERLFKGFKTSFQVKFDTVKPQWKSVAFLVPSKASSEDYGWVNDLPSMREWVGSRVLKSISTSSYTIVNKDYEATVGVSRNKIEDDQFGIYGSFMGELGLSAAAHPDELVFGLLAKGFDTECYDGQNFFDEDHPVMVGDEETSVSNMQDGAGEPWFLLDCSRVIKPVIYQERKKPEFTSMVDPKNSEHVFLNKEFVYGVDSRCNVGFSFWQLAQGSKAELTQSNFRAARKAMKSLKNDEGRPLNINPTMLVVGPSNADKARDLIKSDRLDNGKSNTDKGLVEIIEVPWLA